MRTLSQAEETFLIAIWHMKDNAYGVSIRDKILELTGKKYTYGTLYGLLDQLVQRGYALKFEGDPTSERGGRRKLFYHLTKAGFSALKQSYELRCSLWENIDDSTFEKGYKYE